MNIQNLMKLALEYHQHQEASALRFNALYELLAITFTRTIPPIQRDQELSLSMQEIINRVDFDNEEQQETFLELMGTAKNIIIDVADKTEHKQ